MLHCVSGSVRAVFLIIALPMLTCCTTADGEGLDDESVFGATDWVGDRSSELTSGRPDGSEARRIANQGNRVITDQPSPMIDAGLEAELPKGLNSDPIETSDNGKKVSFAFVDADIQEFVRVVFDEVLKENVVVDPQLQGRVTLRTPEPVSRATALQMVEEVLAINNAEMTRGGGIVRISQRGSIQNSGRVATRVVPIRNIDPNQAKAALQPLAGANTQIAASAEGKFLSISGPPADVDALSNFVAVVDVDQMRGTSIGLVPLKTAGSNAVAAELNQVFAQSAGFKAIPIDRMNAVLLTGRSKDSIRRASNWIGRLDAADRDGRQIFVEPVRNRRATDVATVLSGMLGIGASNAGSGKNAGLGVNPALTAQFTQNVSAFGEAEGSYSPPGGQPGPLSALPDQSLRSVNSEDSSEADGGGRNRIDIRADAGTNSLVIHATAEEYKTIEAAIRSLDVMPPQVLIEATIMEVRLNDALRHGVRWFLESGNFGARLSDDAGGSVANVNPGINVAYGVSNARVVVNALEGITKVQIVSSPALTVLDNQTATLKVGDQVPIATRSAVGTGSPGAPIVNEIQLKDTGVILSVTPRINPSGLVLLDISQEASDVVPTTSSDINSPTIRQRRINSTVAVQSGSEIILGGIITARKARESQGVPVLKDVPVLGSLFTSRAANERSRTELVVIIRPTIMANSADVNAVTQEVKAKLLNSRVRKGTILKRSY